MKQVTISEIIYQIQSNTLTSFDVRMIQETVCPEISMQSDGQAEILLEDLKTKNLRQLEETEITDRKQLKFFAQRFIEVNWKRGRSEVVQTRITNILKKLSSAVNEDTDQVTLEVVKSVFRQAFQVNHVKQQNADLIQQTLEKIESLLILARTRQAESRKTHSTSKIRIQERPPAVKNEDLQAIANALEENQSVIEVRWGDLALRVDAKLKAEIDSLVERNRANLLAVKMAEVVAGAAAETEATKAQREAIAIPRLVAIESAISQGNISKLKRLLRGLRDLRGFNLAEAMEQIDGEETFDVEQQIDLRSKGAILSFRDLMEDIENHLESIEAHPEDQPILKRLYHLLEQYVKNWQTGTLQSTAIREGFDQVATVALRQRYDVSELRGSITQVLNQELQKDKETNQKLWLLDKVPAAIKELFDKKMEGHYLHRLRDWIPENISGYDQIQANIQRAFYARYRENRLEKKYAQDIDNTVVMEILEKLTSQNPNIKPLTPEFGQALVAEAAKVEATDEFKGKVFIDRTPIYKAAIVSLLKKWRDGSLEQETTPELFAEFKGMIESRLSAIQPENPLRENLAREGINLLIAQVKVGYIVREEAQTKEEPESKAKPEVSPEELPEELLDILLKDIGLAIGSIKAKPEEIRQGLRKLLIIKREEPERLTEEEHAHIDHITQERWNHYLTKLRPYAYPILLQQEVTELKTENQELREQLAQMQAMMTQLASQFAQFTGRQETDAAAEQPDPAVQTRSRVGMF
jgi:hypothetical protein